MDENQDVVAVVEAADRAEPKATTLDTMADTLRLARNWLELNGFKQLRIDRWGDGNGMFVELGYVHGEVWFVAWRSDGTARVRAETRKPNDLGPMLDLIGEVSDWVHV